MKKCDVTDLTLRTLIDDMGFTTNSLLITKPVFVEGVGSIVHCSILRRYLDSATIITTLAEQGLMVLSGTELDMIVEEHLHLLPPVSLNALGSHWLEDGQQVVRRYSPNHNGTFKKTLGVFNEKWAEGFWFSCKEAVPQ